MFFRVHNGGTHAYPVPTHDSQVARRYVKGIHERLGLTAADGVSDDDFYSH
jgi:hypothetical protein